MRARVLIGLATALLLIGIAAGAGCGGGAATKKKPQQPTTQEQVRTAQSMFKAGRVTEALAGLEAALQSEPDNARLHNVYGTLCFQAGRYRAAEVAFLRALELDPYLTDAHNFLGAVYQQTGRHDDAEKHYRTALAEPAYPTPEKPWLNLGLLYSNQGRDDEAVDALRTALEINPKFYKAHYELASLLDRRGELEEAAREYEVAEPEYRQVGEYHYRLGWVYFRMDQREQARESLNRAIAVAPGSRSAAKAGDLLKMLD